MKTVSVVIPVYNVEQYLKRCVDSVRNQTYEQLEILLIDDGSPDGCPALCDGFAQEDSRIRVIHQKNIGLGGARNRGLSEATGDYILYVDSDDWIAGDCVETYVAEAEKKHADFVASSAFYEVSGDGYLMRRTLPSGDYVKKGRKDILLFEGIVSMCMKLFRREWLIANSLYQPSIRTYEDWGTYPTMVCRAERVSVLEQPFYYYTVAREGGISSGDELRLIQGFQQTLSFMICFMKDNGLWEQKREKLLYYCLKDYYMRLRLNRESLNREAGELLDRIKCDILTKEFGIFCPEEKNYLVLGSFSLRWEVQKGSLDGSKVDRHFCFSSIISVFSEVWQCDVIHENSFRRRQIEQELRSELLRELECADEHTLFFLDFLEERYDVLEVRPDIYVTDSEAFRESNLKDIRCIRRIHRGSEEYMELWKEACDRLTALLKEYLEPRQVVLVKNRMSSTYGDFTHRVPFENLSMLRQVNHGLEEMEDYFCAQMPGAGIIEMEEEYLFADPGLPYGCGPEYANNAWYVKAGYEIFRRVIS